MLRDDQGEGLWEIKHVQLIRSQSVRSTAEQPDTVNTRCEKHQLGIFELIIREYIIQNLSALACVCLESTVFATPLGYLNLN